MTDYAKLIDAETWAFIDKTNSHYPPDAIDLDMAGQRAVYDRLCAAFHAGIPNGVTFTDEAIDAIPVRRYESGKDARRDRGLLSRRRIRRRRVAQP